MAARAPFGGPLSERELNALEGISHGYTNDEVGAQMFVSGASVKGYLRAVFDKLGARDRAHAVRLGFEAGYLTPGRPEVANEDTVVRIPQQASARGPIRKPPHSAGCWVDRVCRCTNGQAVTL
ncbi:hypothetical protein ALI144C_44975 [Actinosynnema sp. ALI-1.44]|uniref:response regulator transcription factor n=1 Tax=Actinosynnema sp. ALI-1.44 TaxID=1933779 RepID=UPI00097BE1CE|nr:helix-turn-helix transcriptional regulator [Actinosynnema sp. ALI-1.44]ONI73106.1 hypothetical protein ALI144C_44975 [Actinosynnema sp. ALI-1.44]